MADDPPQARRLPPGFADFEIDAVAAFGAADIDRLLADPGIVRHRGKIEATIDNATAARALRADGVSLAELLWHFAPAAGPGPGSAGDLPSVTAESTAMAKELKRRGFRFVGPTTAYSVMQPAGLVNDHLSGCSFRDEAAAPAARPALAGSHRRVKRSHRTAPASRLGRRCPSPAHPRPPQPPGKLAA